MTQTVLIVDDEESIVKLLEFNLEQAGFTTDVAYDGLQAIEKADRYDYDLIILDVMLPGMDGIEVCHYLRNKQVLTPILMLTAKDSVTDKIDGLDSGADDYLTKPFSPKEVLARIRAVLRRSSDLSSNQSNVIQIGKLSIYPDRYEATMDGRELAFTRKQFELLYFLATHKGKVLSRDQLLKDVWDYEFAGDTRIVDVHISHLREKIEPDTKNPAYIKTIRGFGYKLEDLTS
ncbi:response regulator transcription factor [Lentibacillus saliphilus]|uniref:response regulator transcription factor n=1 Tax=Lentibacillus saliphilus TaxID=2737028 RepID=UPI001C308E01|nr:response regulator transcription factor [Lentibacillus saliphilus]